MCETSPGATQDDDRDADLCACRKYFTMALVRNEAAAVKNGATGAAHAALNGKTEAKISVATTRDAEAQRKKARTLAKQQQAAERIAAATTQLSSCINQAASAAEALKRSSDQIATGAEEASGAAQESLTAFKQVEASILGQMQAEPRRGRDLRPARGDQLRRNPCPERAATTRA